MSQVALSSAGVPDPGAPDFLNWVRNEVLRLQQALIPPDVVTNFRATPLSGSIQIDFTRSDGDNFVLYWNSTPSVNLAVRIELVSTNKYVDNIGQGGIKRYYAVGLKNGKTEMMYAEPENQTCVNSVFPHRGYYPCWYLRRHNVRQIDI